MGAICLWHTSIRFRFSPATTVPTRTNIRPWITGHFNVLNYLFKISNTGLTTYILAFFWILLLSSVFTPEAETCKKKRLKMMMDLHIIAQSLVHFHNKYKHITYLLDTVVTYTMQILISILDVRGLHPCHLLEVRFIKEVLWYFVCLHLPQTDVAILIN